MALTAYIYVIRSIIRIRVRIVGKASFSYDQFSSVDARPVTAVPADRAAPHFFQSCSLPVLYVRILPLDLSEILLPIGSRDCTLRVAMVCGCRQDLELTRLKTSRTDDRCLVAKPPEGPNRWLNEKPSPTQ